MTDALQRDRYYVLVAACVLGRGSAWLRSACLAAALLLPAVAALHGIVLAAIHVDGKADPEQAEGGMKKEGNQKKIRQDSTTNKCQERSTWTCMEPFNFVPLVFWLAQ